MGQECADEQVLQERQSSHMSGEGVCIMLSSYFNDLWRMFFLCIPASNYAYNFT